MKKWVILVLVLLGGALLAMQYIMNNNAARPGGQPAIQPREPTGVVLPPGATDYAGSDMIPQPMDDRGDPNHLNIPDLPTDYKGACPGASLPEMKATHGKIWGILATETPIARDDTRGLYGFVADYVGCVAVARDNGALCGSLPPEPPPGGVKPGVPPQAGGKAPPASQQPPREGAAPGAGKPTERDSLRANCRKRVNPVLFLSYMAGKNRNTSACQAVLAGMKPATLAKISSTEFCAAAEKGMEAVNDYMQKALGKKKKATKERKPFASTEAACRGNAECLIGLSMYNAIKSGDAAKCPRMIPRKDPAGGKGALKSEDASRAADSYCMAAISKSAVTCEPIIREMSKLYCAAIEKAKKKTGGFVGMSKAEIENYIAETKRRQKEAELQKKESEQRGMEINKNVKKLMGKE